MPDMPARRAVGAGGIQRLENTFMLSNGSGTPAVPPEIDSDAFLRPRARADSGRHDGTGRRRYSDRLVGRERANATAASIAARSMPARPAAGR